jgi:hypothetical protein
MGKAKNVGMVAGLILLGVLVGAALITIFPLPLPQSAGNPPPAIGKITTSGLFTAISDGAGYVVADTDHNNQHIRGFAIVHVGKAPPPLPPPPRGNSTYIVVTPNPVHLDPRGTQQFTAQAFDKDGKPITGLAFTWSVWNLQPQQGGVNTPLPREPLLPRDATFYYNAKTVISIVNVTLLTVLLAIYVDIYRKVRSKFTVGLIITMLALLVYALTSNPLLQVLFGFRAEGLGPFAMMPDLFATIALSILLYLGLE